MISNTKQNWNVGATVKVGFMSLIVKATIATPGDYAPDAYILGNAANTQLYKFVPHKGLQKISAEDAKDMLQSEICRQERKAETGEQHAEICRLAILTDAVNGGCSEKAVQDWTRITA